MKVAFITSGYPPVSPGGAGISSQLIVQGLRNKGVEVDVFAIIGETRKIVDIDTRTKYLPKGERYWLPKAIGENLSSLLHLPDLNEYDVVHVYNVRHLPAVVLRCSSPIVATFNNYMWVCIDPGQHLKDGIPECGIRNDIRYAGTDGYTGLLRWARLGVEYPGRILAKRADAYTVQTEGVKRIMKNCGYNSGAVRVVPNLLDPEFLVEEENEDKIVFVGRLSEIKGPDMIVRAYQNLPVEIKREWDLEIHGDGSMKPRLKTLLESDEHTNSSIKYTPYSELPGMYSTAGLLVHCSKYTEPFSRTWLEAMASGTPIVCSRNPSSSAVLDGIAELYDPFSVDDLTDTLAGVLSDPKRRREMATTGKQQAKKYRPEIIVEGYIDTYNELTS